MNLRSFLFFGYLTVAVNADAFGPQPRIVADNGHLLFKAAEHRNISFLTQGQGRVHVNGIDLTVAAQISDEALRAMAKYQTNFESSFEKITRFEQILDGNDGLMQKLLQGGNIGNVTVSPALGPSIRRLSRRVTMLQRRVRNIQLLLNKDECDADLCKNGGTCQDLFNAFLCNCPKEWEGTTCDVDVNECARFAGTDLGCQNGATCINRPGSYECVCTHGWFGLHCTRRSSDCNSGSNTELCGHGSCINQNNDVGYKCICDQGWTTDGSTPACNTDVNECTSGKPPCSVNPPVQCVNIPGSFLCSNCPPGYTGNGFYCTDIDECAIFNGGCSVNPMVQCINTLGSKICGNCPAGYTGNGVVCSFQGVCNVNNGGCHPLAACRDNTRISSTYVECICPAGYIGNGIGPSGCRRSSGISTNPCSYNPCRHGICSALNTTDYTCRCNWRYTGRNCDTLKNLCSPNPCLNGGTCTSILGTRYRCTCPTAFTGIRCEEEKQSCGGRLETESGVLVFPSSLTTTYDHSISCAWIIETNITKVLNVTFKRFDVEDQNDCQFDWLQIHDGKNTLAHTLGRFCGHSLPNGGVITSTHNTIYLWFRSDHSVARTGFELSWESVDPVCGDVLITNSHGSIHSPGTPGNYPNNRDCYWSVLAAFGKRLQFHFFTLMIGDNENCDHDYLEFLAGTLSTDPVFAKFCNTSHPAPIFSPSSEVLIHFHSDATKNYPGFQLTYSVVEGIPGCGGVYTVDQGEIRSPSFEGKYPPDLLCEYKISLKKKSRIKLTFLSFALEESDGCQFDHVAMYNGASTSAPLIGRYCGKNIPAPYVTESNEVLFVFKTDWASSAGGFVLKYEIVCGGKFLNPSGVIESPGYPQSYVGENTCVYEIVQPLGTSITLTVTDLDIERNSYPQCIYDFIEVRDGDNANSTLIGRYCLKAPPPIISTHNYLWIKFQSDLSVRGKGFQANYTTTQMGCGGILKEKVGTFSSPQHPNVYPSQHFCEWILSAPPSHVVQIVWMSFHLEQSYKCSYDYLEVFDNNTETGMGGSMGKYCGHTTPPMLLSSSNVVTVRFVTDSSLSFDGFLASYTFIPETNVCGGNYYTNAGVLKSPSYPENYPTNMECIWTINVEPGHQIMLNVTDFNIESYASCRYDWLEIHNGGTASSPLVGKYCGTSIPHSIPSHSNKLYLHFKSDMTKSGKGFKIYWDATATGCGGSLNAPTGSIISPQYPEPYSSNLECIWKISISAGSVIQAVFSDLDLEAHSSCAQDYVELYDGLTLNSKSLGKFCSSQIPSFILTTGNHMLVKFVSDVSAEGRGFQLQYTTMCNNTVTGFRGVIESPNFPGGYPHNLNCIWHIVVSDRNKINITFSHFSLETPLLHSNDSVKNCPYDYVEVSYTKYLEQYEDSPGDPIKYGRYCGDSVPSLITLESDHAHIQFVSDSLLVGSGIRLEWQLEGCGGFYTHPTGVIKSPNYPKGYPPSVSCDWKIQVEFGSSVEVTFQEIDIEKDSDCEYDYIKIFNGEDKTLPEIAKLCHQKKPTTIASTGNFMYIQFKTDYSYQGKGFYGTYTTKPTKCGGKYTTSKGNIMSPNYPKNYDKNDTCGWLIEVDENHVVELTFKDVDLFSRNNENCTENNSTYVKVHDGPSPAYPVLVKVCDKDTPNATFISTYNHMYVELVATDNYVSKGFLAKYRKSCGARIETTGQGVITLSPNDVVDEAADKCSWTIIASDPSKHVSLTITHLDTFYVYCEDEKSLKVYSGESATSPLLGEYCGTKIPPMLTSGGSALHITSDTNINFFATYSIYDSACGGTLTSQDGFFASPGYPKSYPVDSECEWILHVAEGNHISLSFTYFNLLESDNCNTDYLEIRKGNSSGKLIDVFCGDVVLSNLTHMGSLWIYLKTSHVEGDNSLMTAKGFMAEYTLNFENELSGPSGIIESPLYPNSIPSYGEFSWKVTVDYGKKILLTFKEFYVEVFVDQTCFFTRLEVYDGPDDTAKNLGTFCGLDFPKPVKTTSNVVLIKVYYSTVKFQTKYRLEWLAIDDRIINRFPELQGEKCGNKEPINVHSSNNVTMITSPGYPHGYGSNLNCEWIFTTIPMNHVKIRFQTIDLEKGYTAKCFLDYVEIYQKAEKDTDWTSIAKVCTNNATRYIHGTNLMKVAFRTNRYLNGTGFVAIIGEDCGGSITDPSGIIYLNNETSKDFGIRFGKVNCQWNVTVRSGKTIEVKFVNFDIRIVPAASDPCANYLMLRNGQSSDSPLLGNGKYCGVQRNVATLRTTGNHLFVRYSGAANVNGFELSYREVNYDCGGEVSLNKFLNSTEITSPNYPNIPPPHTECSWIIIAPPGETLRIDFHDRFDLGRDRNCDKQWVEIRDGGTAFSPLISKSCIAAPSSLFSTDNVMFVKFFTDVDEPGNGFASKISIAKCGGTLRGRTGTISSPSLNTPEMAVKDTNCTWRIIGPPDHSLDIGFTKMNLDGYRANCTDLDRVQIIDKDIITLRDVLKFGPYCGKKIPDAIQTESNEATVLFQTGDRYVQDGGFTLKFNASLEICGGNVEAAAGVIQYPGLPSRQSRFRACIWTIKVPVGRRVTLEVLDIDYSDTASLSQGIWFFNGEGHRSQIKPTPILRANSVVQSSENFMSIYYWVRGLQLRGFRAKFSSNDPSICVGDFNDKAGTITQPPGSPQSFYCTYSRSSRSTNTTLSLSIQLSNNQTRRGKSCLHAGSFLDVSTDNKKEIISHLCRSSQNSVTVRTPYPVTKITAVQVYFTQFNYTISYEVNPCGGIVTGETGTIKAPGYPNKYTRSIECSWLLKLPEEQTIKLTSTNVDLGGDCEKSYIEIYNGNLPTKPKIGKFCHGNDIPNVILSQTNSLWIDYKFDKSSDSKGFSFAYEPVINGCGGIFHDTARIIQTPGYPKEYPSNAECVWEIWSDEGYYIDLKFLSRFQLESSEACQNDFLEIFDWKNNSWVSLGRRCGRQIPSTFNSTSNRMKLLFRSNDKIPGAGFQAQWEWRCGGNFVADYVERFIVSPGFPEMYTGLLSCQYNITGKPYQFLNVKFYDFNLEGSYCNFDNFTIIPMHPISKYNLDLFNRQVYCGTDAPPDMRLPHSISFLFRTDKYVQRQGFRFSYQLENCGDSITSPTVITSPSLNMTRRPGMYEGYLTCKWNITAPPKKVVVLQFEKLHLPLRHNCFFDNLEIFEDLDMKNRTANLCGNLNYNPPVIKSIGNTLSMRLRTDRTSGYGGFQVYVLFTHGPSEGCGGNINITQGSYTLISPNLDDMDCTWLVMVPTGYSIKIKFSEVHLSGACDSNYASDFIELKDGGSPLSETIKKLCGISSNYAEEFITSGKVAQIRLYTRGKNNNAFKITLTPTLSICGQVYLNATEDVKVLTSPNYPSKYPENVKCSWVIKATSNRVALYFTDFDLIEENGQHILANNCGKDKVQIVDDPNNRFISDGLGPTAIIAGSRKTTTEFLPYNTITGTHQFCGKSTPFDYFSNRDSVIVSFTSTSTPETNRGRGFRLEYQEIVCNRNYTSGQGRIVNINKITDCRTTIVVPENFTISLYFQFFMLFQSPECQDIGMEIREGETDSGKVLLKACGYSVPQPVFSTTNKLWIHTWNKKSNLYSSNFDLVYTSSDKGRGCGGTLYNYKGRFSSPLYPREYKSDEPCIWEVKVPIGNRVAIKFRDYEIQGDCESNYVQVTTYEDKQSSIHKFCQNDNPATLYSGSHVTVYYKSSSFNQGKGWFALFETVSLG